MLQVKTLLDSYILPVLESTGLTFAIFTDTGDFRKATRSVNSVTAPINGLFTVGNSSTEYAGDEKIVAIPTELKFAVPVNDDHEADGSFENVAQFREVLTSAFSTEPNKFLVTENGKTYTVVAVYTFPSTGTRQQWSMTGDSFTFQCSVFFTYLSNAINATDIKISIDGQNVPFLSVGFSRRPSIAANLLSDNQSGEAQAYAENTAFSIDLILPAYVTNLGGAIADYIFGSTDSNTPHTVVIDYGKDEKSKAALNSVEKTMIFGESEIAAQGIENASYKISLISYAGEALIQG